MKQKLLSVFVLCMLLIGASYAQTKQIRGKVTSATTGEPIAGASVLIQGTNQGTQTNASGDFSITFPSTSTHLEIRYIGYLTQTFAVGSRNFAEIRLSVVENSLEEVVVTGAGLTAQRKAIGNAQTTVKSDDILQAKPMNVVTGLTGKVPGLVVQGVSSGVNPNYRVVLRGMRSLTGNNEALIVVDNVIAPSSILGNLNPDDIVDITVLNGSGAAALYGSAASNGALIITTKKGKSSEGFEINLENSSIFEEVSFLPQVQTLFGSGSAADFPVYVPYENQQYGPAFDGSIVEIGSPLEDGSIQTVPYVYSSGKDDFWELGYNNQTSLSLSSRSEKSSLHLAGQYLQATGTVPFDKYNRATARVSGVNNITDKLTSTYSAYVAQNNYDITSEADLVYEYVLNTPGQIPLTDYEDFINNPFATPDGYFNMYYNNPYFVAANNRNLTKNNYLLGNIELKYNPTNWLDVLGRIGYTSSYQNRKLTSGVYLYSDYSKTLPSSYKDEDLLGSVEDEFSYNTKLVTDFIAHATHTNYEIKFDYTAIGQYIQNQYSMVNAAVEGLAVPDLYNLDNSLNNAEVEGPRYLARTIGLAGKIDLAYKNFLFLSLTGRNDWTSILDPGNRSYFYPSASLSFVPTDAFAALKNVNALDFLKLRTGWSRVGQVNLGNATDFGAYYLEPTFSQGSGYPYDGIGGHTVGNDLVQEGLKPEITTSFEVGFESSWLNNRISADFTYYNNKTVDNTVLTGVSTTTGFSGYLTNAGITSGYGIESKLAVTPYRSNSWDVTLGGNYAYMENKVVEISDNLEVLSLGGFSDLTGSYAVAGENFPVIMGTAYSRDPQGRIIVDAITGYPTSDGTLQVLGDAAPNHILGLTLDIRWKDLSFHTLAEYRTGNEIYNAGGTTFDFTGAGVNTVAYNRDRFVIPNSVYWDEASQSYVENTNVTVRDGGAGYWTMGDPRTDIAENYVTSAAFWKIREMSLTYRVPASFLKSQKVIKAAKVSLQGRNLFLWTPASNVYTDPEYSAANSLSNGNAIGLTSLSQTPPSRYYGFSIGLTF